MNSRKQASIPFIALLLMAVVLSLTVVWPFWAVFAWAIVLAILLLPLYRRLERRFQRPTLSALLTCLLVLGVMLIPTPWLAYHLLRQAETLPQRIRALQRPANPTAPDTNTASAPAPLNDFRRWVGNYIDPAEIPWEQWVRKGAEQIGATAMQKGGALLTRLIWNVVQTCICLMTLFFLLRDGQRLLISVRPLLPFNEAQLDLLSARITNTIYACIYGNLIVAVVQGTLAGLAYWVLGVPAPLLWTLVTIAVCMVPLAGAPVVWIPVTLWLAMNQAYPQALLMIVWGMGVVGTIDNLIRPIVVGTRVQLHPMVVFFSILGGVLWLGPLGLFWGPLLIALTLSLLEIWRQERSGENSPNAGETSPSS